MEKKSIFRRIAALLCTAIMVISVPTGAMAASTTTISADTLQKGLQFTLTGMPYNDTKDGERRESPLLKTYNNEQFNVRTVQNFAFTPDNRYIFTVSEGYSVKPNTSDETNPAKKHTILTCCTIPSKTGKTAAAEYQNAVILDHYGHGETIAVTQPNAGKQIYNVWVACDWHKETGYGTSNVKGCCKENSAG